MKTFPFSTFRFLLLSIAILTGAAAWLWSDYRVTLSTAATQQSNVARLLETHTFHVIASADSVLARMLDEVREHDIMGKGADRYWESLSRIAEKLPVSGRLWIYRADGSAVMASHQRHSTNNAGDREYFNVQKTPGVGLYIGETIVGKSTGNKVFNLSRRIDGPDGKFAGVVMAAIDIEVFIQAVSELELGAMAVYTLARSDGAIIMRHPDAGATGKRFNLNILEELRTQRSGLVTYVSAIDGITRQLAFRKPPHLPLAVIVGLSRDEILAPWRERAMVLGACLIALFLIFLWLTVIARRAERRESAAIMRMQTIMSTVAEGICGLDAEGRISFMNPAGAYLLGWAPAELVGKGMHETTHHSRHDGTPHAVGEWPIHGLLSMGTCIFGNDYYWRKDGRGISIEYSATRVTDLDGRHGVVMAFRDISTRVAAELALRRSEEFAWTTIDAVPEHICVLDPSGKIVSVNRSWRVFCEDKASEDASRTDYGLGRSYLEFWRVAVNAGAEQEAQMESGIRKVMNGEAENFSLEYVCDIPDGQRIFIAHIARFHGDSGNILIRHENITERKKSERQLEHLAQTDSLTGLSNRRHFMARARQELSRTLRYGGQLCVLMLDIDHFKQVNDTYGHHTGDLVLHELSNLSRKTLRDIDLIGRVGGEEFAVLLPQTDSARAGDAAERLRRTIEGSPIPLGHGKPLRITVSIGVATLSDADTSLDTLIGKADAALYAAKHGGRNRVCIQGSAEMAPPVGR